MNNDRQQLNKYLLIFAITSLLSLIPFLFVKFLPCTDLPQVLSQTNSFYKAFYHGSERYLVNYTHPNTFSYYLMFALWHFFKPFQVAKISLIFFNLAGIAAIFLIAYKTNRPTANAVFASIFLFNSSFYYGFIPFLSGWPFFALFWIIINSQKKSLKWIFKIIATTFLLFYTHNLWLVAATGLTLLTLAYNYKTNSSQDILATILAILPSIVYSTYWFFIFRQAKKLQSMTIKIPPSIPPVIRAHPKLLGLLSNISINSLIPILIAVTAFLYFFYTSKKEKPHSMLLLTAIMGFIFYFFVPNYYFDTILFSARWLPYAFIFLILSAAGYKKFNPLFLKVSLVIFLATMIYQGVIWHKFEKQELDGLEQCLSLTAKNSNLAWVDLKKESKFILFRPFLQAGSYADLLKDCKTNFSLAYHKTGILQFASEDEDKDQWLFNDHKTFSSEDARKYEYVMVIGNKSQHERIQNELNLKKISSGNTTFQLYQTAE